MDVKAMIFDVIAKDHAGATFHKIGTEAEGAGTKSHKFGRVAGAALAGAAVAAVAFGKKSVDAYQDAAKESMQLARVTGMTLKESSRLRFAAEESGVEFSTLSTSTRIFSKNLGAAAGDQKKAAAMTKLLGTEFKDAHGHLLPMSELLPKVAERFKTMPDGPAKTALAMKLFGKSGADMVKILNKGKDGLEELGKESDKTGNTISNTDSLKKQIAAQRAFHAAVTGLMVTVGKGLTPILTGLALFLTQHVAPAFTSVTHFVDQNHAIISKVAPIVLAVVGGFFALVKILRIFATVMAAVNFVLDANPIGIVVIAIAALAAGLIYAWKHSETFRDVVKGAFSAVGTAASFMWNDVLKPTFKFVVGAFLNVADWILRGAAKAFGWVPGIGPKLKAAAAWFHDFKDRVNNQLDGIHSNVKVTADTSDARRKVSGFVTFYQQQMSKLPKNVHAGAPGGAGDILMQGYPTKKPKKHKATGGRVFAGEAFTAGEAGTEDIYPVVDAMVVPHRQGRGAGDGAGTIVHITLNVTGALDPHSVGRQLIDVLDKTFRQLGIVPEFAK